jgi:hypothetical protein
MHGWLPHEAFLLCAPPLLLLAHVTIAPRPTETCTCGARPTTGSEHRKWTLFCVCAGKGRPICRGNEVRGEGGEREKEAEDNGRLIGEGPWGALALNRQFKF